MQRRYSPSVETKINKERNFYSIPCQIKKKWCCVVFITAIQLAQTYFNGIFCCRIFRDALVKKIGVYIYIQSTLDISNCQKGPTHLFKSSTYRVVILCKKRMGSIFLFETSRVRLIEYSR